MIGAITAGLLSEPIAPVTNSYESIATVAVGSGGSSTISFTSIPSTFKHLQVRGISRASSGNQYIKLRFNNDATGAYTYHIIYADGSTAAAYASTGETGAGDVTSAAGSLAANIFAPLVIDVLDYQNTNKNTTIRNLDGFDANGSGQVVFGSGLWNNTAAINRLDLIPSASTFAQYTQFALYGIKG